MSEASTHSEPSRGRASTRSRTLDDLAEMSFRELGELYASGTVPDSLSAIDGDLVGRMLAVAKLDRGTMRALAAFARRRGFPWAGKSFRAESAGRGTGINRVRLGAAGRHRLFPFETRFGESVIDSRACVVLDYDLADNPAAIRAIHDEVRLVGPRLLLGPACVKRAGKKPGVVLWFALEIP